MMPKYTTLFSLALLFIASGCTTPGVNMLNRVPIHSVDVEVLDVNGNPIPGAQVESSNGRKTTTDENGMASIRFGTLGIHNITVLADNHLPNNMIVTMPADRGKTITARLTNEVEFTGITFGSMNMYPMMFNYLFTGYGYQLELEDYPEGGWTEWRTDGDDATVMRKAFLKELDNGQQWWQIILKGDEEEGDDYIAEVLFSEDRAQIVRMREKIGDNEVQEKPVSEGWYNQPQQLTEESIEGALSEEDISVEVPANTFTADLLNFGMAPGMSMNMWRVDGSEVPGAVVKYEYEEDESGNISSMELMNFGTDAESLLDSF